MNKISDVLADLLAHKSNKSTLGFPQLDNHFIGVDGLILYYFDEELLPTIKAHINLSEVSSYSDLGQNDAYWVDSSESFRDKDWKQLIMHLKYNNCSAIILVPISKSSRLKNQDKSLKQPTEITRIFSFIAEFLNNDLELIIYKNRYSHKGKIQLNLEQKNLINILKYKTEKFNIITGEAVGYKTAVMNTVIKQYLDEGKKICYVGNPSTLSRLLLDLTGHKTKDVTLGLLDELIEKYNKQLFLEVDFAKIDKDVVIFSDTNIEDRYHLLADLPNDEIWQTCDTNRLGDFDYDKASKALIKHGTCNFININKNDAKMILETKFESKGFYFKEGLVDLNVVINLNNYTSLLEINTLIQKFNTQIESLSINPYVNKLEIERVQKIKEDALKNKMNIIKNKGQK